MMANPFPVPAIIAIFIVPTCNLNTLSYENLNRPNSKLNITMLPCWFRKRKTSRSTNAAGG